ncbi:AraC family transcriptional regulator [Thalassoroseus pseudoceratinae]|uniref:AraC family transcriptional regulator n=1 Tax=Thalassoroseus pseudoceratinae TaxID=2713176 RepID=UPI00197D8566|nr:DNA-binding transcriptional regulator [Thalassoroseus pseudoceratinae]
MKRRVVLIIETSSVYGRDLLSGIVRFMRMHDDWSVFLEQRDLWKQPPSWLPHWNGDGIISRVTTPKLLDAVEKTGVPLVEVTDRHGESHLPQVRSDDAAIGRMAANHLVERGFRRFGFCGFRGEAWSQRREEAFATVVERHSETECARYNTPWHGPTALSWEQEQEQIVEWLDGFEQPFAVMACNDIRGQHVIEACSKIGVSVPEQVAVIGVDNDELLCRVCSPPLSSVIPNAEAVGYRAAEVLAELMSGDNSPPRTEIIEPLDVATRQSTDVVAIQDRDIASALRFIRENACRGISVDEVVRNSAVSRSTLERQVRKYLGRTPQEEIRHVQIGRARELLLTTDLPTERIAGLCGFEHSEYFHVVFKRITKTTPGEFRRRSSG